MGREREATLSQLQLWQVGLRLAIKIDLPQWVIYFVYLLSVFFGNCLKW